MKVITNILISVLSFAFSYGIAHLTGSLIVKNAVLGQKVHELEHKLLPLICSLIKNGEIKFIDRSLTISGQNYINGKEFIF